MPLAVFSFGKQEFEAFSVNFVAICVYIEQPKLLTTTLSRHLQFSSLYSVNISLRTMSTGKCPLLSVQPSRGLVDERFQIVVMNLLPNQEVTLHALHQSEDKDFWEAFGHYISDLHGTVTGPGSYPGVLDLWGGGGSLVEHRSALLASHGFVSLALEYMNRNDKKMADVDISYIEEAYQFLQNHPKVQRDHLAVVGLSFGSSVTLSMVAYSNIIKPQCCVCISGSHVVPVDKPIIKVFQNLKFNSDNLPLNEDNQLINKDLMLPIPSDPALKVDVGKITCPLLLVNGGDDENWPSVESAEDMKLIMEKAGNLHLLKVLTYPGAGHLIEPPYTPHIRASNFIRLDHKKVVMLWGGHTKPHAYAQENAWKEILAFLRQHLYFSTNDVVKSRL